MLRCPEDFLITEDIFSKDPTMIQIVDELRNSRGVSLRDNQKSAVTRLLRGENCEIPTGFGKTMILAVVAAYRIRKGFCSCVDIVTSKPDLGARACSDFSLFFQRLGINCTITDSGKQAPTTGVLYGTFHEMMSQVLGDHRNGRPFETLLVDELDYAVIDAIAERTVLTQQTEGTERLLSLFGIAAHVYCELQKEKKIRSREGLRRAFDSVMKEALIIDTIDAFSTKIIDGKSVTYHRHKEVGSGKIPLPCPRHLIPLLTTPGGKLESVVDAVMDAFWYQLNVHVIDGSESRNEKGQLFPVDHCDSGSVQTNSTITSGVQQVLSFLYDRPIAPECFSGVGMSKVTYLQKYSFAVGVTGTIGGEVGELFLKEVLPQKERQGLLQPPAPSSEPLLKPPVEYCRQRVLNCETLWLETIAESAIGIVAKGRSCLIIFPDVATAESFARQYANKIKSTGGQLRMRLRDDNGEVAESEWQDFCRAVPCRCVIAVTNIGSRGNDLILCNALREVGGLHLIDTFLGLTQRHDDQKAGRVCRNSPPDPGSRERILLNQSVDTNPETNSIRHLELVKELCAARAVRSLAKELHVLSGATRISIVEDECIQLFLDGTRTSLIDRFHSQPLAIRTALKDAWSVQMEYTRTLWASRVRQSSHDLCGACEEVGLEMTEPLTHQTGLEVLVKLCDQAATPLTEAWQRARALDSASIRALTNFEPEKLEDSLTVLSCCLQRPVARLGISRGLLSLVVCVCACLKSDARRFHEPVYIAIAVGTSQFTVPNHLYDLYGVPGVTLPLNFGSRQISVPQQATCFTSVLRYSAARGSPSPNLGDCERTVRPCRARLDPQLLPLSEMLLAVKDAKEPEIKNYRDVLTSVGNSFISTCKNASRDLALTPMVLRNMGFGRAVELAAYREMQKKTERIHSDELFGVEYARAYLAAAAEDREECKEALERALERLQEVTECYEQVAVVPKFRESTTSPGTCNLSQQIARRSDLVEELHQNIRKNLSLIAESCQKEGSKIVLCRHSDPEGVNRSDTLQFRIRVAVLLFEVEVKPKKKSFWEHLLLFVLGAIQIVAGAILIATGIGTSIGNWLVSQGINDIKEAFNTEAINWGNYFKNKCVSLLFHALMAIGTAVVKGIRTAYNTVGTLKEKVKAGWEAGKDAFSDALIGTKAVVGTIQEELTTYVKTQAKEYCAQVAASALCAQPITQAVTRNLQQALEKLAESTDVQRCVVYALYNEQDGAVRANIHDVLVEEFSDSPVIRQLLDGLAPAVPDELQRLASVGNAAWDMVKLGQVVSKATALVSRMITAPLMYCRYEHEDWSMMKGLDEAVKYGYLAADMFGEPPLACDEIKKGIAPLKGFSPETRKCAIAVAECYAADGERWKAAFASFTSLAMTVMQQLIEGRAERLAQTHVRPMVERGLNDLDNLITAAIKKAQEGGETTTPSEPNEDAEPSSSELSKPEDGACKTDARPPAVDAPIETKPPREVSPTRPITREDVSSWVKDLKIDENLTDQLHVVFQGAEWNVDAAKNFLARMKQETQNFTFMREKGNGAGFNVGRGFVQLTGKENYEAFQKHLDRVYGKGKYDVLSPAGMEKVATDRILQAESAKFFALKAKLHDKAQLIDSVKAINGGLNGLQESIEYRLKLNSPADHGAILEETHQAFLSAMSTSPPILQPGVKDFKVGDYEFNFGVAETQKKLAALGYDIGGVDGKYGPKTVEAVKQFQQKNGLPPDGKVGPMTQAKLSTAKGACTGPKTN